MTKMESEVLLNTKFIGNKTITPSHKTQYNTRTGTMLLDRLRLGNDESDDFISEVIKEFLIDQKQNVQKVKVYNRINKNGKNMKLARVIFAQQTVPGFMKVSNKNICIGEELPTPMICKYCLKFGHMFKQCANNMKRRFKCGSVDHSQEECNTLIWFHCTESRQALSK